MASRLWWSSVLLVGVLGFSAVRSLAVANINAGVARIEISTLGGLLAFDEKVVTANAGETVRLTFRNQSPKGSEMGHILVLVRPGAAVSVAKNGMDSSDVIAHTGVVEAGDEQTIMFKVPLEPGDYTFFCANPRHSSTMQGVLRVMEPSSTLADLAS